MKKIAKIIGLMSMAALVAFSASSCKKTDEKTSFRVSLPQVQGLDNDERAYIDVDTESPDYLRLKWNDGDAIMVYNLADEYTQSVAEIFYAEDGAEGHTSTTFSGTAVGPRKDIGYFYFYPAEKASGELQADNRETFTVGDYQEYTRYIFDPTSLVMACKLDELSDNVTMDHIFGVLNLKIRMAEGFESKHVESIEVRDDVFNLSGEMSLKLPVVNADRFRDLCDKCYNNTPGYDTELAQYLGELGYESSHDGDNKSMFLDCTQVFDGEGVQLPSSLETRKKFFISLRPGALYRGFTVTINFVEGGEPFVQHFDADNTNCIRPAYFTNIPIDINK